MMSGGHEVDVGREGGARLQVCTSERVSYQSSGVLAILCERLGSCLAMERSMMKSSVLLNVDPCPPTSNSRPPDSIHVMSVPKPSLFFFVTLLIPCINAN